MKIAALYCRVSTDRQEQEATIQSQIDEVEAKIKEDGNVLKESLRFFDDGWSGELLIRPALDAMRDAASRKEFDILYVYDRGRLSRKFAYQEIILEELSDKGIEFVTLHDVAAMTPEEKVLQAMQGVFHEYERIKIAERMRRGKLFKVKNGVLFGWQAPYGYRYVKDEISPRFDIVQHEAEVVCMIYDMIGADCLTVRQVIKRLHELDVKPRKSKKGTWSTSTLSRLLRDETYIGTTYYNKKAGVVPLNPTKQERYKKVKKSSRKARPKEEWYPLKVPAIVEEKLFYRVQEQLELNNQFAMRNKKNEYMLSSLVYCSCGKKRSGEGNSKTGNLYYRCTDRVTRFPLPKECHAMGANAHILDDFVWSAIKVLLQDSKRIKDQADRWISKKTIERISNHNIEAFNKELAKLDEEEKRYLSAFGEGVITIEQYKEQIKLLNSRRTIFEAKAKKGMSFQQKQIVLPSNLDELCDKITTLLKGLTLQDKQFLLRKLLDRVITDGKTAIIKGYIPIKELEESEDIEKNVKFWSISRNCWVT